MKALALVVALGARVALADHVVDEDKVRSADDVSARAGRLQGGAQLHYEAQSLYAYANEADAVPSVIGLAGARAHAFLGGRWLGYHIGADFAAGGTLDGFGVAYDGAVFPIGLALRFRETSFVTIGAGVGGSGSFGSMPHAATLPLELRFEIGRGIRVLGRARATFVAGADLRQDGARIADELEAMLALRVGRGYSNYGARSGNGYFIGVACREQLGATLAGAVIGYSLDIGSARR